MDPRAHVALALVRLHAAPPPLPAIGTLAYRSRLLDETGGDFKPLVVFLLQLAEAGVPEQIAGAARDGEAWEATHRRLALAWATDHYTQPDMARWGVAAWGAALGRCPVPDAPVPEPPLGERPAANAVHGAHPSAAPRPAGAQAPRGAGAPAPTVTRAAAARPHAYRAPPSPARGGSRLTLNRAEKQALASIALTGLVAAALIAIMGTDDNTGQARGSAPALPAIAAESPASSRLPADFDSSASRVLPPRASLDSSAIARLSPAEGAAYLRGPYRIVARRQRVVGDDGCDALATTIPAQQWAVDTIVVDAATLTFHLVTRPAITGRVGSGGSFVSRPTMTTKDGTRSSYQLEGQLTPWGFEATGTTRSESTLRWRRTLRCEFVASLSGQHVP
ncbi:MAG: hypothetical protein U0164_11305 [Gemmatimonadaceae bacterium]